VRFFFDRYKNAYTLAWMDFHKEIQSGKFEPQTSEYSLAHPSFKFTYKLLGEALAQIKKTSSN